MLYIVNLLIISPRGEEVNYILYASSSFEVAKPHKITVILAIIIIYQCVVESPTRLSRLFTFGTFDVLFSDK